MVGLVGAALMLGAQTAHAVGTVATTPVDNRASVNYTVGGIGQTVIESSPVGNTPPGVGNGADTQFLVDRMLDLMVTEQGASYTSVTPGATLRVLTLRVRNTGNDVQDFSLSAADRVTGTAGPFGGLDAFDTAAVSVLVDFNGNSTYDAGVDVATFIDELAADTEVDVFIVSTIPGGLSDGDLAVLTLTAQVAQGNTVGQGADILTDDRLVADDPAVVQNVFADGTGATDGPNDGRYSDSDGYIVASAQLTITKASAVISDPVGGANPKAIPGAVIEYTITIANAAGASADANGISIADDLSLEIASGSIAFVTDAYGAGPDLGIRIVSPTVNGDQTTALDGDNADFGGTAADTVTATGLDLQPGENATVQYRVQVQ